MQRLSYIYILTNKPRGTLYTGVTTDLPKRLWQHREGVVDSFSRKYGLDLLVYYELFGDVALAIRREKAIKKWRRLWKIQLIESVNPEWKDLAGDWSPGGAGPTLTERARRVRYRYGAWDV